MSVDLGGFSPTDVKPQGEMTPLPAAKYQCIVAASERKPTKNGDGAYLELKLQVVDGEHKGRVIFDRLNLWNKNPVASQIAQSTLSALCHAMGHLKPVSSSAELHGKPFVVDVGCRPYHDRITNEVKAYVWKKDDSAEQPEATTDGTGVKAPWM